MGISRCTACGSDLPGSARFCPHCGVAMLPSNIPVFDLAGGRDELASEPPSRDHSITTVVGVVLGVIALVIGLSLLGGGSGGDDAADDDSPPTTPRSTTTALASSRESAAPQLLLDGAALDPSFGLALVWMRSNGTVVVADLATGNQVTLDERLPSAPLQSAQWTGDAFLVQGNQPELLRLDPSRADTWEVVDTLGYQVGFLWPGAGGLVWAWGEGESGSGPQRYGRIGSTGAMELIEFAGVLSFPSLVIDGRPVFSTPDGVYLVGPDGTPRRYGYGTAVGGAGPRMVRRLCDDVMQCRLILDDVVAGTTTDLGPVAADVNVAAAFPSPDGTAVAVVIPSLEGGPSFIRIIPVDGSPVLTFEMAEWGGDPATVQWSPDSDGLVWINGRGPSISSVRWRNGEISAEPADVAVSNRLMLSGGYSAALLVPVDRLPAAWVTGLG